MMKGSVKGSFEYYYEDENGYNPTGLSGEIKFEGKYHFTPGEEMVRYYKDGSGYPGSPPEFEFYEFVPTNPGLDKKIIGDWLYEKFQESGLRDRLIEHVSECIKDEEDFAMENHMDYLRDQQYG